MTLPDSNERLKEKSRVWDRRNRRRYLEERIAYNRRPKVVRMGIYTRFGVYDIGGYPLLRAVDGSDGVTVECTEPSGCQ